MFGGVDRGVRFALCAPGECPRGWICVPFVSVFSFQYESWRLIMLHVSCFVEI